MKYVGEAAIDYEGFYGIVLEYKKIKGYYPYRVYFPIDDYDDWFTVGSVEKFVLKAKNRGVKNDSI